MPIDWTPKSVAEGVVAAPNGMFADQRERSRVRRVLRDEQHGERPVRHALLAVVDFQFHVALQAHRRHLAHHLPCNVCSLQSHLLDHVHPLREQPGRIGPSPLKLTSNILTIDRVSASTRSRFRPPLLLLLTFAVFPAHLSVKINSMPKVVWSTHQLFSNESKKNKDETLCAVLMVR